MTDLAPILKELETALARSEAQGLEKAMAEVISWFEHNRKRVDTNDPKAKMAFLETTVQELLNIMALFLIRERRSQQHSIIVPKGMYTGGVR